MDVRVSLGATLRTSSPSASADPTWTSRQSSRRASWWRCRACWGEATHREPWLELDGSYKMNNHRCIMNWLNMHSVACLCVSIYPQKHTCVNACSTPIKYSTELTHTSLFWRLAEKIACRIVFKATKLFSPVMWTYQYECQLRLSDEWTFAFPHTKVTHKNISLWKSSSASAPPGFPLVTFPSALKMTSSAGRLVMSNLSTHGRSLRNSARQCLKPSCVAPPGKTHQRAH